MDVIAKRHNITLYEPPHEFITESGKKLGPINVYYETYGELSRNKDNIILNVHALTGNEVEYYLHY